VQVLPIEEPGTKHRKRIAPASAIYAAHQRVCTFDEATCVAVDEIIENEVAPPLNGFKEVLEYISDLAFLDGSAPLGIARDGLLVCTCLINLVEILFPPVCGSQTWKLAEPTFEYEELLRGEVAAGSLAPRARSGNCSPSSVCSPLILLPSIVPNLSASHSKKSRSISKM
jgi:hypothetical protein